MLGMIITDDVEGGAFEELVAEADEHGTGGNDRLRWSCYLLWRMGSRIFESLVFTIVRSNASA